MLNTSSSKTSVTNKINCGRDLHWVIVGFAALAALHCKTVQFTDKHLRESVMKGSFAEYELAKKEEVVEILGQPCSTASNCDTYESPSIPAGKYQVDAKLSQRDFGHLIKSAEECSKQLNGRNEHFFGKTLDRTKLADFPANETYSQNMEVWKGYEGRIQYYCNCHNNEKGLAKKTKCEVPIYDTRSDKDRVRITQLIEAMDRREKFAPKEKLEKETVREETKEERTAREKSAAVFERDRKRTKLLVGRAIKEQYDYLYNKFLCRNDAPIEIMEIDNGELVPCVEGLNQNTLKVEVAEEYYYRITLRCARAGTNFSMDYKTFFRSSKDGKKYSFIPYRVERCDDGILNQ